MSKVTKTINPLHFEDLEPHRFEDLVRQLIYDFRNWRSIEATGKLGSEGGFDIRAWETAWAKTQSEEGEEPEKGYTTTDEDKIWMVQCKREKSIPPSRMSSYMGDIVMDEKQMPYGIVFVSACDFSKKTRDVFREKAREKGFQEFYLWGKAELEDLLFQPKYDHLLFAYFGISLVIRHRSQKTQLRSRLVIKKKALNYLGEFFNRGYKSVLVRDIDDTHYPYKGEIKDFDKNPKWKLYRFLGHEFNGIKLLVRQYFAYIADDCISWDYFEKFDFGRPHEDQWGKNKRRGAPLKLRSKTSGTKFPTTIGHFSISKGQYPMTRS